ncbi:tRNA (mo5U34)-methyltransferase [Sedimentisphaera salicampi]|uniref:tRNA (Mo5U34)-methyltransferase n=2 Tax=Sedimentisphaera salicampi TaxID=1941349 RepID=A0A1W6LP67_9BACT|nr:tRNA (mo5U34)-methyltransferase [Sedimentisphaera salicampi]
MILGLLAVSRRPVFLFSNMNAYNLFFQRLKDNLPEELVSKVRQKSDAVFSAPSHGDFDRWLEAVEDMPDIRPESVDFSGDFAAANAKIAAEEQLKISRSLKQLHPWRKGPFDIFGVHIDAEWKSSLKWERIKDKISSLSGRKVLDVGSGNGYYGYRMLAGGAELVLGLDPTLLFVAQFLALNKYFDSSRNFVLPLGIDDFPKDSEAFDTVFSMGVLYHRRDALEHLNSLAGHLRKGGEVVLETLIIDSREDVIFAPKGRYAKMRNVWNLASPSVIMRWLENAGLKNVSMIDKTPTTSKEQRKTDWMSFESLDDFLDPQDKTKTIEGHQAPIRAAFTASK